MHGEMKGISLGAAYKRDFTVVFIACTLTYASVGLPDCISVISPLTNKDRELWCGRILQPLITC